MRSATRVFPKRKPRRASAIPPAQKPPRRKRRKSPRSPKKQIPKTINKMSF